jgi:hypothetical protein
LPVFSSIQEKARATQDLNNLRQLGIATQTYLNDNDSVIFVDQGTTSWMKSLHPKYLPSWKIFQSPFDRRTTAESEENAPVSYGINSNALTQSTDKIHTPSVFILFAPAQNRDAQVLFEGLSGGTVTVLRAISTPPGSTATGGTHQKRRAINALFGDLHAESLSWETFKEDAGGPEDDSSFRWEL